MWQASPTKQFSSLTLFKIDEPSKMIEFSHITPEPIYTLASGILLIEQSLSRHAPITSQSSLMFVLVISEVLTIFTPKPIVPLSGILSIISLRMRAFMAVISSLSLWWLTIRAASCEVSPSKSITLPSPASLSTLIMLPCPKVAPSVVSIVFTFEI